MCVEDAAGVAVCEGPGLTVQPSQLLFGSCEGPQHPTSPNSDPKVEKPFRFLHLGSQDRVSPVAWSLLQTDLRPPAVSVFPCVCEEGLI